jgi:hypothetical protein
VSRRAGIPTARIEQNGTKETKYAQLIAAGAGKAGAHFENFMDHYFYLGGNAGHAPAWMSFVPMANLAEIVNERLSVTSPGCAGACGN